MPIDCELKLEVWDSPSAAGVAIGAGRRTKLARDRSIAGALTGSCSYLMQSPPRRYTDEQVHRLTEAFVVETTGT